MTPYFSLASCYDSLTSDVDYAEWANFYEAIFKTCNLTVRSVLDLACGTGTLSYILAERGYEVIGADASPDMLAEASAKASEHSVGVLPMFIHQSMQELDLYGTVDAVVCCLDGINYLPGIDSVKQAFGRVRLFLEPGGVFIFDVLTPEYLQGLDGQVFIDENEDAYCVWRAEFDGASRACCYGMDIFRRRGSLWRRDFEEHIEYAYSIGELRGALVGAGFADIEVCGALRREAPREGEQRLFFIARKPGVQTAAD